MLYVCNLQNIHSLSNVVILFTIKTCQPCHYIKPMTHVTRASATRIKTRVSGLPMVKPVAIRDKALSCRRGNYGTQLKKNRFTVKFL